MQLAHKRSLCSPTFLSNGQIVSINEIKVNQVRRQPNYNYLVSLYCAVCSTVIFDNYFPLVVVCVCALLFRLFVYAYLLFIICLTVCWSHCSLVSLCICPTIVFVGVCLYYRLYYRVFVELVFVVVVVVGEISWNFEITSSTIGQLDNSNFAFQCSHLSDTECLNIRH